MHVISLSSLLHLVITASVFSTGKGSLTACWHWRWSIRPCWLSTAPVSTLKNRCCIYLLTLMPLAVCSCGRKARCAKNWGIWSGFVLAYVQYALTRSPPGLPLTVLCFLSRRSRLADYMVNCWVTPHTVSTCPNQDNHQACLASYARLIGQWNKNSLRWIACSNLTCFYFHHECKIL